MLSALLLLSQPVADLPADPVYAEEAVPDPVLAEQRGGFRLPNGIDVALTVQTQTVVDGAVVLHTVFALDQGPATLAVYAPRNGTTVMVAQGTEPSQSAAVPTVSYDSRTGVTVAPGFSTVPVSVGTGAAPSASLPAGLAQIDPTGTPATDNGVVSGQSSGLLRLVTLSSPDFNVAHFAGSAFGSAIANSGSDRAFDTVTSVSIDLRDAGPDVLGSAMFRVENVALGALGARM